MGTVTIPGAILIITGWFALVEYDNYSESERKQILQKIKNSPLLILLIALMPLGILFNSIGGFFGFMWMVILGSSFIFLQGIIVSLLFWKRKRWKSILLLIVIVALGTFIYTPLIIH